MMTLRQRGMPQLPLDLNLQREHHPDILDEDFWSLVPLVYDYTELPTAVLHSLYSATRYVIDAGLNGDIIECGVHMGGSVMMAGHVLMKYDSCPDRRLFALDTFTGFVRRHEELDVDAVTGAPVCFPEDHVDYTGHSIENMQSVGFKRLDIVKGDVLNTIPTLDTKQIALLRLDTDTYDTTKFELEELYDRVVPGGVVIVDDYGYTVGCRKAVDDFVASKPILLHRVNPNVRTWVKA